MTAYSVMKTGPRYSVLATWPGAMYEHTVKVTTLDSEEAAHDLAIALTGLSEAAWDAAVWTDAGQAIPPAIAAFVEGMRSTDGDIPTVELSGVGYRHADTWSFERLKDQLGGELYPFPSLTRAQRLTVADEIAADAAERDLLIASAGREYTSESRAHQACLVTRVEENGSLGPVPEGGAGWMRRHYPENLMLHERWRARAHLLRMEQLVTACNVAGGRAQMSPDPFNAHCVVAAEPGQISIDDIPFMVTPVQAEGRWSYAADTNGPLYVRRQSEWIGTLDPADDDGFAALMGEWTRAVPYSA
ncbi:hypothetical protein [Prescottella agglutinans]|uniref:Uncharacterized protein n=1 Tax=Prescottella agglutinans TaxID=1644129 RepID=A0ABT6MJ25_9NOCA|nr:hypothetical protein [Prescottella agglutinans]MDH6284287.1 hypothetical protein [Prescottella agglutinans]